jgi:predicted ATPase
VRIAISGSHRVGKTSLLHRLADALPDHDHLDEPYELLDDEGHLFADPPSADDYEVQLQRSIREIVRSDPDTLFDRSPADFLAYLQAIGEDVDDLVDAAAAAMATLDLVVLVPIEAPDRVVVAASEDRALRSEVDQLVTGLLVDDGLAPELLVVHGDLGSRLAQVLAIVEAATDA